jgi:hypothetical protein
MHINALAYGPNIGKEFEGRIGDSIAMFSLDAVASEVKVIKFENPNILQKFIFSIHMPVSPKKLGLGKDDRQLRIGFF